MRLIDAEPLEELLCSRAAQCSDDYGSLAGAVAGCLKLVQSQPIISPPANPPLTWEELREMDGEPVWVTSPDNKFESCWMLINLEFEKLYDAGSEYLLLSGCGKAWMAYRRKPEEGAT